MIYDEQGFAMQGLEGGSGLMGWLSHSVLLFPPSRDAVQSIQKKVTTTQQLGIDGRRRKIGIRNGFE